MARGVEAKPVVPPAQLAFHVVGEPVGAKPEQTIDLCAPRVQLARGMGDSR